MTVAVTVGSYPVSYTHLDVYKRQIVTVDEVKRGKGFPDIYEEAARRIHHEKKDCVVFEDILTGVMGAKAGGFTVVAVEDEKSECNKMKIREIADYYIEKYPFV